MSIIFSLLSIILLIVTVRCGLRFIHNRNIIDAEIIALTFLAAIGCIFVAVAGFKA